jgi:hypothetical protein
MNEAQTQIVKSRSSWKENALIGVLIVIHVWYISLFFPVPHGLFYPRDFLGYFLFLLLPLLVSLLTYFVILLKFKFRKKRALKTALLVGVIPIAVIFCAEQVIRFFSYNPATGGPQLLDTY